jgi:integrase
VQWKYHGRLFYHTIHADSLKDAEAKRDELLIMVRASIVEGTHNEKYGDMYETEIAPGQKILISLGWQRYLQKKHSTKKVTLDQYGYQYTDFCDWMSKRYPEIKYMTDVTKPVAKAYLDFLSSRVGQSTYNRYLTLLKMVFTALNEDIVGYIDPWKGIKRERKQVNSKRPFSPEELTIIYQKATGDIRTLCLLGFHTGLRLADCCTLLWDECNFESGLIKRTVRKTGAEVTIPIATELRNHLKEILPKRGASKYVCPEMAAYYLEEEQGRRQTGATYRIQDFLVNSCGITTQRNGTGIGNGCNKRAIVDKGFHSFRHTWVTEARKNGVDRASVEAIIGWGNPQMEKVYTHVDDAHLKEVIDKMKPMMPPQNGQTKHAELPSANVPVKSMSTDELAKTCAAIMAELEKRKAQT